MKTLSKNNDLIIQISERGNSIIVLNKTNYLDKIYNILSDSKKFGKSSVLDDKHFNFNIGIEKKLTNLLKELKSSETISEIDYQNLKPRDSSFGVVYGLCKTHKMSLTNAPHLDSFYQQIKLPLTI